ncbi:MAG: MoaD/ThiS family protein [Sediminibacterium sp.]|nr:MoaD/ThiS family protein [uncultured Sediminibacterium sp.]
MKTEILLFGQLVELIGTARISMEGFVDSASLIAALKEKYPVLNGAKFVVAINQEIIKENSVLKENSIVALLPPFSGG